MPSAIFDTHSTRTLALVALTLVEILLKNQHEEGLQAGTPGVLPLLKDARQGTLAELKDLHPAPEDIGPAMHLLEDILLRVVRPDLKPF